MRTPGVIICQVLFFIFSHGLVSFLRVKSFNLLLGVISGSCKQNQCRYHWNKGSVGIGAFTRVGGGCWGSEGLESYSQRLGEIITKDLSLQHGSQRSWRSQENPRSHSICPPKGDFQVGACGERSMNPLHLTVGMTAFTSLRHPDLAPVPVTGGPDWNHGFWGAWFSALDGRAWGWP